MSGFDWKLPADIQGDKDKERKLYFQAISDTKHPQHHWAKDRAEKNKMSRINFFKGQREKYKGGSAIHKALNKHK